MNNRTDRTPDGYCPCGNIATHKHLGMACCARCYAIERMTAENPTHCHGTPWREKQKAAATPPVQIVRWDAHLDYFWRKRGLVAPEVSRADIQPYAMEVN